MRCADQPAVDAVTLYDVEIGAVIGDGQRGGRKFRDIFHAARFFKRTGLFEFVRQGHDVDRLSRVENDLHRTDDQLMRFLVKIVLRKAVQQLRLRFVINEQTAEQRLLGFQIVR